jgi:hypothetical protein
MRGVRGRLAAVETALATLPTAEVAAPALAIVGPPAPVMVRCARCDVTFDESEGAVSAGGETFHATRECGIPRGPFIATEGGVPARCGLCAHRIMPGERFTVTQGPVHVGGCPPEQFGA